MHDQPADGVARANVWMIDFGKTTPLNGDKQLDHRTPWVEGTLFLGKGQVLLCANVRYFGEGSNVSLCEGTVFFGKGSNVSLCYEFPFACLTLELKFFFCEFVTMICFLNVLTYK